ncbi:spore coat protein CotJB [Brevibacillus sp. HB1.2]|uniref:spore coat protein CotJB n=1 Tax=Brevibacillus TaxID=55080 RepID=UPI00156AC963|nr:MULTISPECIES: spore coat protein CotJB [unclassified Brevibacillus]NRS14862.1 spore coat protein CotJB [Brevibacillus sp. HB1.4B]NTU19466.1 spore coat protein CotJB [Brevibacillus sp. HB1.2]NTU30272.1 spore coat protein CotJB [Brevibacillus sp. HB1.1]
MTAENRFGDEQYYALLEQLQAIDFVLVELSLYLDTHPTDQNALQQYNDLTEQRWGLANEYEKSYGPLQNLGRSYSGYPWQWNDDPWPWQV